MKPQPIKPTNWGGIIVVLIVIGIFVAMANASVKHDAATPSATPSASKAEVLAANMKSSLSADRPFDPVTDVFCIHESGSEYACHVTSQSGQQASTEVTLSDDWSWVSH